MKSLLYSFLAILLLAGCKDSDDNSTTFIPPSNGNGSSGNPPVCPTDDLLELGNGWFAEILAETSPVEITEIAVAGNSAYIIGKDQTFWKFSMDDFTFSPLDIEACQSFTVSAPSENHVFFFTHSGETCPNEGNFLWRSNTGGELWEKIELPVGAFFMDAWFVNQYRGFAFVFQEDDLSRLLWSTQNGGISWEKHDSLPLRSMTKTFSFIDENTGFALGEGHHIYKTMDSGFHWETLVSTADELLEIQFIDEMHGYASKSIFDKDGLYQTRNGGLTWTRVLSGKPSFFHFVDQDHGLAITETGFCFPNENDAGLYTVFNTDDAGLTWQPGEEFHPDPLAVYGFNDSKEGLYFDRGRVYKITFF